MNAPAANPRVTWANGVAFVAALVLTAAVAWQPRQSLVAIADESADDLTDSAGHVVARREYRRIVSTSMMIDRLLVEMAEPDRIVAFSGAGARVSKWAYQYAGKATLESLDDSERIIALKPDLVLANSFGRMGHVAKLRAAGIEVFDFGEPRGVTALLSTARRLGALLGSPERGERFARGFERRLGNVAARRGERPRRSAMYVSVVGTRLFGGTVGTSYHDVLTAAGLEDVAARSFRDWPDYSAEQMLALAPELVVTKDGMARALCAYPGLDSLPACRPSTVPVPRIVELPAALLDEPGPVMLDAAETLFDKVYGAR